MILMILTGNRSSKIQGILGVLGGGSMGIRELGDAGRALNSLDRANLELG